MNPFSERALILALKNVEDGGHPFGAVLVCDGEIIAEGVNELHLRPDVSAHAELVAIKKA
ncbi:deaminase, partial [Halobacillus trueperi]